jgi:hypothetical protein
MGLTKIMYWLAGADRQVLERVPTHVRVKYTCFGALVLTTAAFASLSSGYALFTVFPHPRIAIFFGVLWGFMISSLDRLILTTFPKHGSIPRQLLHAAARVLLALVIAITVAHPLTLLIFEPEILDRIARDTNSGRSDIEDKINNVHKQGELERQQIREREQAAVQQEQIDWKDMNDKENLCYQELARCAKGECDSVYTKRIEERCRVNGYRAQHTRNSFEAAKLRSAAKVAALEGDSIQRENEAVELLKGSLKVFDPNTRPSLLRRSEALGEIADERSTASRTIWFVRLLFLCVETIPVFLTIITPLDSAGKLKVKIEDKYDKDEIDAVAGEQAKKPSMEAREREKRPTVQPGGEEQARQAVVQAKTDEGAKQPAAVPKSEEQAAPPTAQTKAEERPKRPKVQPDGEEQARQAVVQAKTDEGAKQPTNEVRIPSPYSPQNFRSPGGVGHRESVASTVYRARVFGGFFSQRKGGKTSRGQKVVLAIGTAAIMGVTSLAGYDLTAIVESAALFVALAPLLMRYEMQVEST